MDNPWKKRRISPGHYKIHVLDRPCGYADFKIDGWDADPFPPGEDNDEYTSRRSCEFIMRLHVKDKSLTPEVRQLGKELFHRWRDEIGNTTFPQSITLWRNSVALRNEPYELEIGTMFRSDGSVRVHIPNDLSIIDQITITADYVIHPTNERLSHEGHHMVTGVSETKEMRLATISGSQLKKAVREYNNKYVRAIGQVFALAGYHHAQDSCKMIASFFFMK